MASEGFHEARKELSRQTRDKHRALVSLSEELEAVDWYCQRAEACDNADLAAILRHNMHEEMEHASMILEWLRRNDEQFGAHLAHYLFSEGPITGLESDSGAQADERAETAEHSDTGQPAAPDTPGAYLTIGSLKE